MTAEFKRTLLLCFRNKVDFINAFVFFIIGIITVRLGMGREAISETASFGIIVSYLVFTLLLTTNLLFNDDHASGVLDEQKNLSYGIEKIIIAKYLAWLFFITISVFLFVPISTLIFNVSCNLLTVSIIFLVILNQTLLCMLVSALILEAHSSILASLLVLPISIPLVILSHLCFTTPSLLAMLLGMFLFFFPLAIKLTAISIANNNINYN